jgi:hypothetical protein
MAALGIEVDPLALELLERPLVIPGAAGGFLGRVGVAPGSHATRRLRSLSRYDFTRRV